MDYIKMHIPILKGKRPGIKTKMTSITIHNTGNPTSTALSERNWLTNPINNASASWHICVDSKQAIEAIPLDEVAYHSGNSEGNNTSIGIEICESGNYRQNEQNAVELIAKMLMERGWGVDRVKRHKDWNGKNCPRLIIPYWYEFLDRIQKEIDKAKGWKDIIREVAADPENWITDIETMVKAAEAEGNIGPFEKVKFFPLLIEKTYNSRG